jgi:hypothetical protein
MEIHKALQKCLKSLGWSKTRLASEVGVTEESVRTWLAGETEPRVENYRTLRSVVPGFAKLVDGGV